jgi:REP element-mobilizing transposase RayT
MELLKPTQAYHIYNHANGSELLFKEKQNYKFFLDKYRKYISPVADTHVYCLMPNHFHILVRIKREEDIISAFNGSFARKYNRLMPVEEKENLVSLFASKQFSNLFSSYTQAFNKTYDRMGSLFMKNFKRKIIEDDRHYKETVIYIHLNPVHHDFVNTPYEWPYSSYGILLSGKETWLKKDEVINSFDNVSSFETAHQERF